MRKKATVTVLVSDKGYEIRIDTVTIYCAGNAPYNSRTIVPLSKGRSLRAVKHLAVNTAKEMANVLESQNIRADFGGVDLVPIWEPIMFPLEWWTFDETREAFDKLRETYPNPKDILVDL